MAVCGGGVAHACMHTYCIHTQTHATLNCKWLTPLGGWAGRCVGANVSTITNQQTESNYLNYFKNYSIISDLKPLGLVGWLGGPGACTHAKLNWKWLSPLGVWVGRCVGGEVSTSHKSSNRIEISQSVQDLFHF